MTSREVLVIGGGPAGLCAAIEAAKSGAQVLLVDENAKAGGQLFKQIHKFFGSKQHQAGIRGFDIAEQLLAEADRCGVQTWLKSVAVGLFKDRKVAVKRETAGHEQTVEVIQARKIVIATGGSENAVRFPGWTLPGVMGAGAVQTLINVHRVLPGKRILMIGSGNVGLIVSYQLLQAGAEVAAVVEAAPCVKGYGVHAAKIRRAGVPIRTSHAVLEARGHEGVEEAVVCRVDESWRPLAGSETVFRVDTIAIAAGLRPLTELARMGGCECAYHPELGGWVPLHDENMESTRAEIYVVGDASGIEEANTAMEEGRIAGVAIAESLGYLCPEKASESRKELWSRLQGLRLGPFGRDRFLAKRRIIESCKAVRSLSRAAPTKAVG
jgi:thioredoxin reductase